MLLQGNPSWVSSLNNGLATLIMDVMNNSGGQTLLITGGFCMKEIGKKNVSMGLKYYPGTYSLILITKDDFQSAVSNLNTFTWNS
jgi:hypothetical protein